MTCSLVDTVGGETCIVLSVCPGVLLAILVPPMLGAAVRQPPVADETRFGFGIIMQVLMTILSELVALGLGVAGVFERQRK